MKKLLKWLLGLILVLVLLAGIVGIILINLTPKQLHLQSIQIGEHTIEELDLADTKIITIYKNFNSIRTTKENEIVRNGYSAQVEQENAKVCFEHSSLSNENDYTSLLTTNVTYDKQYLLEYDDTTIAYLFNHIIKNAYSSNEAIQYLHDANVLVKEISIVKESDVGTIRIVSYMNISEFKEVIEKEIGRAKAFIKIPDSIYMVSEFSFTVDSNGKMETAPISITINGKKDDPVGKAVLKIALENIEESRKEEDLNDSLGKALESIIYHLGKIGSASVNIKKEITGDISLGFSGIKNHRLTVITQMV